MPGTVCPTQPSPCTASSVLPVLRAGAAALVLAVTCGAVPALAQHASPTPDGPAAATPGDRPASASPATISTRELLSRIEQPWVQLVDVRSAHEFAGRDIRALRGGHIPGAVNLPFVVADAPAGGAGFARSPDGLDPRKETIVYGHGAEEALSAARLLGERGFRNLRVYAPSWEVWGNTLELPVAAERFADVGALRDRVDELERRLARALASQQARLASN